MLIHLLSYRIQNIFLLVRPFSVLNMPNIAHGYLVAHNLKILSCMLLFLDTDYSV